jgi:hypothetical protein
MFRTFNNLEIIIMLNVWAIKMLNNLKHVKLYNSILIAQIYQQTMKLKS